MRKWNDCIPGLYHGAEKKGYICLDVICCARFKKTYDPQTEVFLGNVRLYSQF